MSPGDVEHEFGVTLAMDEIERVQTPAELQRMIDDQVRAIREGLHG